MYQGISQTVNKLHIIKITSI